MYLNKEIGNCELCSRFKPLSEHHYIPVSLHKNKWFKKNFSKEEMKTRKIKLCNDCHRNLHDFKTEKVLGKEFNTKEKLLQNKEVQKFVSYIKKKH